jgi:hypothetical protein
MPAPLLTAQYQRSSLLQAAIPHQPHHTSLTPYYCCIRPLTCSAPWPHHAWPPLALPPGSSHPSLGGSRAGGDTYAGHTRLSLACTAPTPIAHTTPTPTSPSVAFTPTSPTRVHAAAHAAPPNPLLLLHQAHLLCSVAAPRWPPLALPPNSSPLLRGGGLAATFTPAIYAPVARLYGPHPQHTPHTTHQHQRVYQPQPRTCRRCCPRRASHPRSNYSHQIQLLPPGFHAKMSHSPIR